MPPSPAVLAHPQSARIACTVARRMPAVSEQFCAKESKRTTLQLCIVRLVSGVPRSRPITGGTDDPVGSQRLAAALNPRSGPWNPACWRVRSQPRHRRSGDLLSTSVLAPPDFCPGTAADARPKTLFNGRPKLGRRVWGGAEGAQQQQRRVAVLRPEQLRRPGSRHRPRMHDWENWLAVNYKLVLRYF